MPAANGLTCSNCARTIREAEAEAEAEAAGWRYRSNGVGDLHVFCPACAVREFAPGCDGLERGGQLRPAFDALHRRGHDRAAPNLVAVAETHHRPILG